MTNCCQAELETRRACQSSSFQSIVQFNLRFMKKLHQNPWSRFLNVCCSQTPIRTFAGNLFTDLSNEMMNICNILSSLSQCSLTTYCHHSGHFVRKDLSVGNHHDHDLHHHLAYHDLDQNHDHHDPHDQNHDHHDHCPPD